VLLSTGSGVALSSGLMKGVGEGLAGATGVGLGFGFTLGDGEGEGDSSALAGLLAWNGVDAASCARTRTAETARIIPITNERIMPVFNFRPTLACARPMGQEQYHRDRHDQIKMTLPTSKSQWTRRTVATKSCFLMRKQGVPLQSWR
jgi:hypothetical protein